jgi:pimeloyl-ACP methyl ester carboxylesterase
VIPLDQQVKVGDFMLRVQRVNSTRARTVSESPVLVFLHDSLGCVETWRDFPQRLADRVGLDSLIYDRRGYGQSPPFGREARTAEYLQEEARVLFMLLEALAIERVVLFGHSDGGSIALIAAAQRPGHVDGVITEGAHVFVEDVTLSGIRKAQATLASTDLRKRLARYHGSKADAVVAAWIDTWLSLEFRDWNIESFLPRIVCPVLAIQGDDDEYGTPAQVQAIVYGVGAHARSLMLPRVGHTPHRVATNAVLDGSAEFLASNSLAR